MGCGTKCSRYLLMTLLLFIFGGGTTLLVSGLFLLFNTGFLSHDVTSMLMSIKEDKIYFGLQLLLLTYGAIAVGGLVIILSVLGFIGAWKKITCLLGVAITMSIITLLLQGTLVGLWINTRAGTDEWLDGQLRSKLETYVSPNGTDSVSNGFNSMFLNARCCGVTAYTDFATLSTFWSQNEATVYTEIVPATCCKGATSDNYASYVNSDCTKTPQDYYTEGCFTVFQSVVEMYSTITYIIVPINFVLKILAIVMSCVACDHNKNRIRDNNMAGPGPKPYIGIDAVLKHKGNR